MTDTELATKAPESDAQETTPSAAPATSAPRLSDHCTSSRPTPAGQSGTGEITTLGDIDVYISKPSDYPHTPSKLLLLLTSGTGIRSVNNQIQADRFASEGYVVVMPDLFGGDPAPNTGNMMADEPTTPGSFLDTFKIKAAETAKTFLIDMWLARHTQEKVLPIMYKVIDSCKDEFADAVSTGGGIYAVGYCFGARYVLLLGGERKEMPAWQGFSWASPTSAPQDVEADKARTVGPFIKAGALAHPTMVSPEDFVGLKAPVTVVAVENDPMCPDEVRMGLEDYMSKNNVEHEVQVYPGVPHGFAVVGEYDDVNIQSAQSTAFAQMLKWIKEH
ncbi:Alpha/Beta hydrolase protein [Schizothecium vesticola]|uniref:Alpha/Beta hydrolase protein n=1 Tax=Schizothecium vesticola TaxID=314040 RepID=A0AA40K0M8_9PEZI|nr:Alpha/Beta hydrolase protein [Schizothecium vesticola]